MQTNLTRRAGLIGLAGRKMRVHKRKASMRQPMCGGGSRGKGAAGERHLSWVIIKALSQHLHDT